MKKEYDFSKGKVRKSPIADSKTSKVQTRSGHKRKQKNWVLDIRLFSI
jgi:hypothetical protein